MMNDELSRALSVYADGKALTGFRHVHLTGRDALGLYPMPFTLRLWNLADSDYHMLRAAGRISVMHEQSVLAAGRISEVYMRLVPEGKITEVVFAAGLGLWETPVSLSVEAGVSVSETEGTKLTYSTDGGNTWSEEAPSIRNVGKIDVIVGIKGDRIEIVIVKDFA